ncbi:hypothetical protein [Streptacidiphilus sp. PAMC 29251]
MVVTFFFQAPHRLHFFRLNGTAWRQLPHSGWPSKVLVSTNRGRWQRAQIAVRLAREQVTQDRRPSRVALSSRARRQNGQAGITNPVAPRSSKARIKSAVLRGPRAPLPVRRFGTSSRACSR